jgi:hypothetical protein
MNQLMQAQIMLDLELGNTQEKLRAIELVREEADVTDMPWLVGLLHHESFIVRETAAWPLAELAGPSVLSELFAAYQLGLDEKHDNDGFTAALLELLDLHPQEAEVVLRRLAANGSELEKRNAACLLEYYEDESAQLGAQADAANGAA